MRRRDYYWSLFHIQEKRQLNDLRTDQVDAIFDAIPEKNKKDWLIWREGFRTWKPFPDFTQLIESLRAVAKSETDPGLTSVIPQPPSEEMRTGVSKRLQSQESDDEVTLTVDAPSAREDRDNGRYEKSFKVRIFTHEKAYANATVNISLRGMQLKSALPKGLTNYFNVEVDLRGRRIPLICSEIPSKDKSSPRLRIEVNNFMHALQEALISK